MNTIVLVGPMGCGKTSIANELVKNYGYKKIVTYTTRPRRDGEEHGIDYRFITTQEFEYKIRTGFFAEWHSYEASFGQCYYGSAHHSYGGNHKKVIILNPYGVEQLTVRAFIVYLNPTKDQKYIDRILARGDSEIEVHRRLVADQSSFDLLEEIGKYHMLITSDESINKITHNIYQMTYQYGWNVVYGWNVDYSEIDAPLV